MTASCFDERQWSLAHGRSLTLGPEAQIMGVLNVTPDSFSDGGVHLAVDTAVRRGRDMVEQGAAIVDIGGESTRPGATPIDAVTEQSRILPVIEQLASDGAPLISVDTYRADTARLAIENGAHIINDIWGCQRDTELADVASKMGAGMVIMNNRRDRIVQPNLLSDAKLFLAKSLKIASGSGVAKTQIVLDPGFGFSACSDDDLIILRDLEQMHELDYPLMVGMSRKRFLGEITGRDASDRAAATSATSVVARQKGAAIFRVHDIGINKDALAVADALIAA